MPVTQISEIAIERLHPHPANVHKHSKKQIAQIVDSIAKFGFTVPIITEEKGYVLAGHGRLLAARAIGLCRVPVIIVSGLSDAEQRAYLLADNKLTENAGWDRTGLAKELQQLGPLLSETGLDIGLTGFGATEIDALMGNLVGTEQDSHDDSPDIQTEQVTRTGDLWILDGHRIGCGSAKNNADLQILMGGERAAMVFADPLVNTRIKTVQGCKTIGDQECVQGSGELQPKEFACFLVQALSLTVRYSVTGAIHYVCIDWCHLQESLLAGNKVYGALLDLVVWVTTTAGQGSLYRSQHELILVFKNGETSHVNKVDLGRQRRNRSNVWNYAGVSELRADCLEDLPIRRTAKPIALVADAMRDCSQRGGIVLDPFMGSGTTILAAERVGRRGYGLEIDPRCVDAAVRRWQLFTKRDALLKSTGRPFSEVATARSRRSK